MPRKPRRPREPRRPRRPRRRSRLSTIAALPLLAACAQADSPTSHTTAVINGIEAAHVQVAGTPVEGTTLTGESGGTVLELQLRNREPLSLALVAGCGIDYDLPMAGPDGGAMGQRRTGRVTCHDDASHGDDVAADGVCHYADDADEVGCGRAGMPSGTYSYRFWCSFADETHSEVTLVVERG